MLDRTPAVNLESAEELRCLAWAGRGPGRLAFQPRSVAMSVTIHLSLVFLMFTAHVATKAKKPPRRHTTLLYMTPVAPAFAPVRPKIAAPRVPLPPPARAAATLPPPSLPAPPIIELPAARPAPAPVALAAPPPKPAASAPAIQIEVFASAASAVKSAAPAPRIRTGEFDSVQSPAPQQGRAVRIVAAGFGDAGTAPVLEARRGVTGGAGFGDAGTAPAVEARRGVAVATRAGFGDAAASAGAAPARTPAGGVQSAGFGDTAAASQGGAARRSVRAGGFGDAVASTAGPSAARAAAAPPVTAAQILEKPKPAYTDEARRLRIQGAVQLVVTFRASGEVEVVRIVRGLGHGLDENAVLAARAIRFLPAKRDGQPVDSTATVHIIFQLAS